MSKALWNILLIASFGIALWWSIRSGSELWRYFQLQDQVLAEKVVLTKAIEGSKYRLVGSYSYQYQGVSYTGQTRFSGPLYLNPGSIDQEIKRVEGMSWAVWLNSKNPQISSLEKKFPYRKTVYGGCLIGIFFYFLGLRVYLQLLARS
jgi:hypothetical protein